MTKEELLEAVKSTLQKTKVHTLSALASRDDFELLELIDLSFYPKTQIAFRAAWILENVCTNYPQKFMQGITYFIQRFPEQLNLSAQRHYTRIMCLLTAKKNEKALEAYDLEPVVDTLFSWLIDEKTPVAVKSNAIEALANLIPRYPWIKEELEESISYFKDKESVAFFGRAKKVRSIIKRNVKLT